MTPLWTLNGSGTWDLVDDPEYPTPTIRPLAFTPPFTHSSDEVWIQRYSLVWIHEEILPLSLWTPGHLLTHPSDGPLPWKGNTEDTHNT